jgi:hypothetical protein
MRSPGRRTIGATGAGGLGLALAAMVACGPRGPSQSSETTPTITVAASPTPSPAPTPKPPLRQAIKKARELSGLRSVAFAVITSDGHVFPERLIVRKNLHYVVWIGDGDTLKMNFKDQSDLPLIECEDAVCWVSQIGRESGPGGFPYEGTIQTDGNPEVRFDPRLEVVK